MAMGIPTMESMLLLASPSTHAAPPCHQLSRAAVPLPVLAAADLAVLGAPPPSA